MRFNFIKKENGVTMIELLIAMSLFAIFIAIAVGGFVQALRNQRLALKLMSSTNNMSMPLEQMMREIRVASDFNSTDNSLSFSRVENVNGAMANYRIEYYYDAGLKAIIRKKTQLDPNGIQIGDPVEDRLTTDNVDVDEFKIITSKDGAGPERVTIIVAVSAIDKGRKITNHIQTTVSARVF